MNRVFPVLMLALGFVAGTSLAVAYAAGVVNFDADVVVDGTVTIQDGTEGLGKVFTSDGSGTGSWQDLAAGPQGPPGDPGPPGPSGSNNFISVRIDGTQEIFGPTIFGDPSSTGFLPQTIHQVGGAISYDEDFGDFRINDDGTYHLIASYNIEANTDFDYVIFVRVTSSLDGTLFQQIQTILEDRSAIVTFQYTDDFIDGEIINGEVEILFPPGENGDILTGSSMTIQKID